MQTKVNEWDYVKEQISRSKIKRISWRRIFGTSLTQKILELKMQGYHSVSAIKTLAASPQFQKFIIQNPDMADQAIKNLKNSVCSRYSENQTAMKIWRRK